MSEDIKSTQTVSIKGEKLEDLLDFIKGNETIKILTKNLKPEGVFVNRKNNKIEITIVMSESGLVKKETK